MKIIALALFVLPLFVAAQDCKLNRDVDPYTKEVKLSTGFIELQGGSVTIDADSKEVDIFFTVPGKCLDDQSTIFVYFEGSKTKTSLRNYGSMNCDGNFHYVFRNSTVTPTIMNKMSTMAVTQFVLTGTDKKAVTISLLPEQQKVFMQSAACMAAQAKTLMK